MDKLLKRVESALKELTEAVAALRAEVTLSNFDKRQKDRTYRPSQQQAESD